MLGGKLKTLKFINGDIEFYTDKKLSYDERFLTRDAGNILTFMDYEGRVGLNNCFLYVKEKADVRGVITVPSFMIVKGNINLLVSPDLNLSVRSSEQGFIDGTLMEEKTPRYVYGPSLSDYARMHFKKIFREEDFWVDMKGETLIGITRDGNAYIGSIDLCKNNRLVYIESGGKNNAPIIDVGYSLDDLAYLDIQTLDRIEKEYAASEQYENAASVLKEKKSRNKN